MARRDSCSATSAGRGSYRVLRGSACSQTGSRASAGSSTARHTSRRTPRRRINRRRGRGRSCAVCQTPRRCGPHAQRCGCASVLAGAWAGSPAAFGLVTRRFATVPVIGHSPSCLASLGARFRSRQSTGDWVTNPPGRQSLVQRPDCVSQICLRKSGIYEARGRQLCAFKVRAGEVRVRQVRASEVRARQARINENDTSEIRVMKRTPIAPA